VEARTAPSEVCVVIRYGDIFDEPDTSVTPGHTPGRARFFGAIHTTGRGARPPQPALRASGEGTNPVSAEPVERARTSPDANSHP
jgi:hypothetical protein